MSSTADPIFNIVLVSPVIPQNSGNIGRLSAASSCRLHFVKPLGFELTDRYLKRAGLDYWPEVNFVVHESWEAFLEVECPARERIALFSTHGKRSYYDIPFERGQYLIFGSETTGLAPEFHEQFPEQRYRIPIDNRNIRSLNLANAVAITVYEGRRQLGLL